MNIMFLKMRNQVWFLSRSVSKAFTLPEIIISMAVLLMTVVGATQVLVSIIRSNNENVHALIAYQLAQEGLEGFRNVRDSNWLLNADFDGQIDGNKVWDVALPAVPGTTRYYILDYKQLGDSSFALPPPSAQVNVAEIPNYAPWKLSEVQPDQDQVVKEATLYLHAVNDPANPDRLQTRYVHAGFGDDKKSIFSRYLKVEALPYEQNGVTVDDSKVFKYRVTAVVSWKEQNRDKDFRLVTELTDWKGGRL